MGKASGVKQERKHAANDLEQKAISAATDTTTNDMLIVMELIGAVELDDVALLKKGLSRLEQAGGSVYSFKFDRIDENGVSSDVTLTDYALSGGATEVSAWLIRRGMTEQQPDAIEHAQQLMSAVNHGGYPQSVMDRLDDLCRHIGRPHTLEEAKHNLSTVLSAELQEKRCVQLWLQEARDFLATHVAQCGV